MNESNFGGIRALVAKACNGKHCEKLATKEESAYHLKVAQLCSSITQQQQELFAEIMRDSQNQNIFTTTKVPVSIQDINRVYVRGKNSLINASPSCKVENIHDHAYVSLTSVINNFLAFDHTHDSMFTNETNIISNNTSNISKEEVDIRRSITNDLEHDIEPLILFVNLWSDDFEVNVTRNMGASAWVLTASISQRLENEQVLKKTYVIALGLKTTNHDAIHELVFTELQNLYKYTHRFYAKMRKTVPVIVRVLSVSADRPERSALTGIMSHTGTFTKRWMYCGSINEKNFHHASHAFDFF